VGEGGWGGEGENRCEYDVEKGERGGVG